MLLKCTNIVYESVIFEFEGLLLNDFVLGLKYTTQFNQIQSLNKESRFICMIYSFCYG